MNRMTEHTCEGIRIENFLFLEYIHNNYHVEIDFYLIRSSNDRYHI